MPDISQEEIDALINNVQVEHLLRTTQTSYNTFTIGMAKQVFCDKCGVPTRRLFCNSTGKTGLMLLDTNNQPIYTGRMAGMMVLCLECKSRWFLAKRNE